MRTYLDCGCCIEDGKQHFCPSCSSPSKETDAFGHLRELVKELPDDWTYDGHCEVIDKVIEELLMLRKEGVL